MRHLPILVWLSLPCQGQRISRSVSDRKEENKKKRQQHFHQIQQKNALRLLLLRISLKKKRPTLIGYAMRLRDPTGGFAAPIHARPLPTNDDVLGRRQNPLTNYFLYRPFHSLDDPSAVPAILGKWDSNQLADGIRPHSSKTFHFVFKIVWINEFDQLRATTAGTTRLSKS